MERADVLIVGGGPAGSACAARLVEAGRDVLVLDAATFPRDKPCAGWITPEVTAEIPFTIDAYATRHVVQPISRFRIGRIGGRAGDVDYGAPVSYGIRRVEFDAELLRWSGARVRPGTRVRTIARRSGGWVLDETFEAPVLVGAGGHFCPVARLLGGPVDDGSVVVAREIELPLEGRKCLVEEERPELYFCRDLAGYGWCFRKRDYLNVGLGRLDPRRLPEHLDGFLEFLIGSGRIERLPATGFRGHAYQVRRGRSRPLAGEGVLLVGDAAGLASSASGEGILPARISGRLAAEAILTGRIGRYEAVLSYRLGPRSSDGPVQTALARAVAPALLSIPAFARRVVLDTWFLHAGSKVA